MKYVRPVLTAAYILAAVAFAIAYLIMFAEQANSMH